jgi:predicted metal-dependent peptidase
MEIGKNELDVKSNIRDLIRQIPLLGFIIIKLKWSFSNQCKTAAIDRRCRLLINKEYFSSLTNKERVAILKHESLHVAHRHFERLIDVSQPQIATIAKEISINQYIEGLPEGCPTVENYNLDKGLSLEEYYKLLIKIAENDQQGFADKKGDNPLDGDADNMGIEAAPMGDKICQDAKDYAKGIGKETTDLYEKVQIVPTNYKAKINKLIGCQPSQTEIKKTNLRRSKRFARSPGIKKMLQLGPCIMGLDTSGSMSKEELSKAIDVAKKLRKKCSNVWLIQGDTEVKDINKVKKGIKELEVKGRGGTELEPIIDKAIEFGYPKVPLIMFTDGEIWNYPSTKKLKNSVWVFTSEVMAKSFHEKRPGIDYAVLI